VKASAVADAFLLNRGPLLPVRFNNPERRFLPAAGGRKWLPHRRSRSVSLRSGRAALRLCRGAIIPPMADAWVVYIVRCRDGSLYTGIAKDADRRCAEHNAGAGARYTRARRPVAVVYREPQPGRSEALKREAALKRLKRHAKEALVRAPARPLTFGAF
jgi:putative endonuclease